MSKAYRSILTLLVCFAPFVSGQTNVSTNSFTFTIEPPAQTIMITETTNPVSLIIGDYGSFSNVFGNVSIDGSVYWGDVDFVDGEDPDETADDGIYTGNIITPLLEEYATNFTLRVVMTADDLTMTNDPPAGGTNIVEVSVTNTIEYIIVPRPVNDDFEDSIKLKSYNDSLVVTATNDYGSLEAGEPVHADVGDVESSVWWTWSSPVSGNVLIDTAGSSFDTVLGVYTGNSVDSLTQVASATYDDENQLRAHANIDATLGRTYRIAVAGRPPESEGDIRLRIVLDGYPDTNGPIAQITAPEDDSLFTTNMVEFTGTAEDVNPDGSGVRQVLLSVNDQAPVPAEGTLEWNALLNLPPGTNTVSAFAVDYAGNTGDLHSIIVKYINPTNDHFTNSIALEGANDLIRAINGRATIEPGEPIHALNDGGHSIWYSWTAPDDGFLSLSTAGSDFDTLLALYAGDSLTNLTEIAGNDDVSTNNLTSALTAGVTNGVTYRIAVDGFGGDSGNIVLSYYFEATEDSYSLTINPVMGGTVSLKSGVYIANTNLTIQAFPSQDFEFVRWEGSYSSEENPFSFTLDTHANLTAVFRVKNYTETFESEGFQGLPWTSGGDKPWIIDSSTSADGDFAARSGDIEDGQETLLSLTTNTLAGTGSFDLRVSSESGWDELEFSLNGRPLESWSGETGWLNYQFKLPEGTNTMTWRYHKDSAFSEGRDSAWIDNLYLPLLLELTTNTAANLQITLSPDSIPVITISGQESRTYVLETSTNLINWSPILTNHATDGVIEYEDTNAQDADARFYRAVAE